MTIRIKISNEDSRDNAIVKVRKVCQGGKSLIPVAIDTKELKGGESVEECVYDGQSVIVEEVQNG